MMKAGGISAVIFLCGASAILALVRTYVTMIYLSKYLTKESRSKNSAQSRYRERL